LNRTRIAPIRQRRTGVNITPIQTSPYWAIETKSRAEAVDPRVEHTLRVVRQAVVEQLGDVGYGGLTIESVAARAGVAKSTIYRHWRDKIALIADAFENAHMEMVPSIESGSARERIERLVRHVAELVLDSTFSRAIPALIEGAARDPRLRDFHHAYSSARRESLVRLVEEGTASGEFAGGTDPELATTALLGAVFYCRLMSAQPFEPKQTSALVHAVLPANRPQLRRSPTDRSYVVNPIGHVESSLVRLEDAPCQGEGAPPAWLAFDRDVADGIADLRVGEEIIVLTWLDQARRDELRTYPEDDESAGLFGVFSTRSPDRPNPLGLHRVRVLAREGLRLQVSPLEAIDRTPIVDVKPVLDVVAEK
jgi:TetR/AcrR family transcriptional regulator of autoinduction and epiphytic fitness